MGEGANDFFSELLKGFGGTVMEEHKARQQRDFERSNALANLFIKGVFAGDIPKDVGYEEWASVVFPMLQFGERGRKGKQSAAASLLEPANAAAALTGFH